MAGVGGSRWGASCRFGSILAGNSFRFFGFGCGLFEFAFNCSMLRVAVPYMSLAEKKRSEEVDSHM